jgi:hypothetical protein
MRTIGYARDGTLTRFGREWHLSTGRLLWLRYAITRWVDRVIGYDPDRPVWFCRWLGLSGYDRLPMRGELEEED